MLPEMRQKEAIKTVNINSDGEEQVPLTVRFVRRAFAARNQSEFINESFNSSRLPHRVRF